MTNFGTSYFGNRILKHVRTDMNDLAGDGFTQVFHTFSENDFHYYGGTMAEMVRISNDAGLEVYLDPWGVGGIFGGEAFSRWVAENPERCQRSSEGRHLAMACPGDEKFREFMVSWIDAAAKTGASGIFWDEPHFLFHKHSYNLWSCRCSACMRRFQEQNGHEMPVSLTPEVLVFRDQQLLALLDFLLGEAAQRSLKNSLCLLPFDERSPGVSDWEKAASLCALTTLATDPYWAAFNQPMTPFVGEITRKLLTLSTKYSLEPQIWIQAFRIRNDQVSDTIKNIQLVYEMGVRNIAFWGFEACEHMSHLRCEESLRLWNEIVKAIDHIK